MKAKDGAGGPAGSGDAIVYSKFDFSAIEKQKKNKNKDYKQLLAKVWNESGPCCVGSNNMWCIFSLHARVALCPLLFLAMVFIP